MATKNLEAILDQENWIRILHKQPPITIKSLTQDIVDGLVAQIDNSLSPENLHCDGEISASQARAKYRKLTGALKEIEALGFAINPPEYSDFFV